MAQSIKAVCGLVILISIVAGAVGWLADRPDATIWKLRIGSVVAIAASVAIIALLSLRRDEVPDFLYLVNRKYFNRNGFCFALAAEKRDRLCLLCVYYQNQHENPCQAIVAFRPTSAESAGEPITVAIDCPPAGFGVVRVPVAVPYLEQGSKRNFQVGATVNYPEGKGRRLLKRDGFLLRTNADFTNRLNDFVQAGMFVHAPVTHTLTRGKRRPISTMPAAITFPMQVATRVEEVQELLKEPEHKTLWQLGEPVPETAPV